MNEREKLVQALAETEQKLVVAAGRLADAVLAGRERYHEEMEAVRAIQRERRRIMLAMDGEDCPECEGRGHSWCPCCQGWAKVLPNEALRWSDRATEPDPDEAYDRRWL